MTSILTQAQTTSYVGLGGQLTVNTEFTMVVDGTLAGVWYYSPAGATALPAQCGVFRVSDQALIASTVTPSWSGAAGSGWILAAIGGSVTLHSGVSYLASVYLGNTGVGGKQTGFWTTGPGAGGFSNSALSAPNFATSTLQGAVQSGNPGLAFPTITENGSFYGPDVEVTTAGPSFSGSVSSTVAFGASVTGSKSAAGSVSASMALGSFVSGLKRVAGVVSSLVAFGAFVQVPSTVSLSPGLLAGTVAGEEFGGTVAGNEYGGTVQ